METYEGTPCRWCGKTTRKAANRHCVDYYHVGHAGPGPDAMRRWGNNNYQKRIVRGVCHSCSGPLVGEKGTPGWKSSACWKCLKRNNQRKERLAMGEGQNLSTLPEPAYETLPDGRRTVKMTLPIPSYSKHTRTALTAKPGFRPLVAAAKSYRNFLLQMLIVSPPPGGDVPWLRKEYFWVFDNFVVKYDHDQWAGGLVDDFVHIGLTANDKHCKGHTTQRTRIENKADERIVVYGYEIEA